MLSQEIVSVHLGHYANHVATHFWNLQDELLGYTEREEWAELASIVDHAVLFNLREADRQGSISYHPRALFVDLSGSLGGVRFGRGAAPAGSASSVQTWAGQVDQHAAPPAPTSKFVQQLLQQAKMSGTEDESVLEAQQAALEAAARELDGQQRPNTWTDFLKVELPSLSVWTLPGVWHGVTDFGCYNDGAAALGGGGLAGAEAKDEMLDRVRVLCEECDSMQGFQVFADDLGGFGSITQSLLEELRSDYSGKEVVVMSVRQPPQSQQQADVVLRWTANEALTLAHLPDTCSLYVPLAVPADASAFPHLRYKPSNPFHTSAILAAAIDAITFPTRLHPGASCPSLGAPVGASGLRQMVHMLKGRGGANLAAASMYFPAPAVPSDLHDAMQQADTRMQPSSSSSRAASAAPGAHPGTGSAASAAMAAAAAAAAPCLDLLSLGYRGLASLTPRVQDPPASCLAESWTLRGACLPSGDAASTSQALSALDAMMVRAEPRRCVRHRCVAPLPLAVPLPFPCGLFAPGMGPAGQGADARDSPASRAGSSRAATGATAATAAGTGATAGAGVTVETCALLTRLTTTTAFEPFLEQVAHAWSGLRRSGVGQALLDSLGYGGGEAQEVGDALLGMAASYHGCVSDDEEL